MKVDLKGWLKKLEDVRIPTIIWVLGMLIAGAASTVTGKLMYELKTETLVTHEMEYFKKPWLQTLLMFYAMIGCLIVYPIIFFVSQLRDFLHSQKGEKQHLLSDNADDSSVNSENDKNEEVKVPTDAEESDFDGFAGGNVPVKSESNGVVKMLLDILGYVYVYVVIVIPASCDMVATVLMSIGLLWTTASIWQMLRGSILLFTALISVIWFKKKLRVYHLVGIGLCTIALIMVGVSSVMNAQQEEKNVLEQIIGITLITAAQFVQALQTVVEEFLLKKVTAHPVLIVGMEGFWGAVIMMVIFMPILYFIPASGLFSPLHEDSLDSIYGILHSWQLSLNISVYMFVILWYNLTGMYITKQQTAIHRNIQEAVRTLLVWVSNLAIYYLISGQNYGESWTWYSFLELAGFVTLIVGTFVYNRVFMLPGVMYEIEESYEI